MHVTWPVISWSVDPVSKYQAGSRPHTLYQDKFQTDQSLNHEKWKHKSFQILSCGRTPPWTWSADGLSMTRNPEAKKKRLKNLSIVKKKKKAETSEAKLKGKTTNWKKLTSNIIEIEPIPLVCKQFLEVIGKWPAIREKNMQSTGTADRKGSQVAFKYMKRGSTSLIVRDTSVLKPNEITFLTIRWAKIRILLVRLEKQTSSYKVGRN